MTDVIFLNDVHLSDKPPQSRVPGYTEQILDKVRFVSSYALEHNLPIVQLGDWFHLKEPSKSSHSLVQQSHEALQGVETFILPGNHDLRGNRLDSIAKQPLGALCRMKNVHLFLGKNDALPGIGAIPFLYEFDGDGDWREAVKPWLEQIGGVDIIATHAPFFPPGKEPGVYFSIPTFDWATLTAKYGIIQTIYGHIHDYAGVYEVEGHTFCNQGALSRGSLHESSVSRKPAATLFSGGELSRLEIPHLPPTEVFLLDQAEQKAVNKASALEFAEALGATKLTGLTLDAVTATMREQVKDKEVLNLIEQILEDIR